MMIVVEGLLFWIAGIGLKVWSSRGVGGYKVLGIGLLLSDSNMWLKVWVSCRRTVLECSIGFSEFGMLLLTV